MSLCGAVAFMKESNFCKISYSARVFLVESDTESCHTVPLFNLEDAGHDPGIEYNASGFSVIAFTLLLICKFYAKI